jgi:O-antigen/teichoic acid export membrane protein
VSAAAGTPTSSRALARNVGLNLAAQTVPLAAGLALTPYLIETLGTERFGALTLAMVAIGYLGVFDLGFGRAVTKLVAERLASDRTCEIPLVAGSALTLQLGLGLLVGVSLVAASGPLVTRVLALPADLRAEAALALWFIAASVPVAMQSASLQGLLEAYQRFDLTSVVRIVLGTTMVVGPALAAAGGGGLAATTGALLASRVLGWIAYATLCRRLVPSLAVVARPDRASLRELIRFGGWLSIANVAGPIIVHADRFILGSVASMSAVAYFATPYDAVTKLWFIPDALLGVLFPAFSASLATDPARAVQLFRRGARFLFLTQFPVILAVVVLAPHLLEIWIGPEFALRGARVLQLLTLGVFVNGLARVPFVFLQSAGWPHVIAAATVAQLVVYPFVSLAAVRGWGADGAAAAWLLRIIADCLLWSVLAVRAQATLGGPVQALLTQTALALVVIVGVAWRAAEVWTGVAAITILSLAFLAGAWRWGLSESERSWALGLWRGSAAR